MTNIISYIIALLFVTNLIGMPQELTITIPTFEESENKEDIAIQTKDNFDNYRPNLTPLSTPKSQPSFMKNQEDDNEIFAYGHSPYETPPNHQIALSKNRSTSNYHDNPTKTKKGKQPTLKQRLQEAKYISQIAKKFSRKNTNQIGQIAYTIPRLMISDVVNNGAERNNLSYISLPTFLKIIKMPILRHDIIFYSFGGACIVLSHRKLAKRMKNQTKENIPSANIAKEKNTQQQGLSTNYGEKDIRFVDISELELSRLLYRVGISLLQQAKSINPNDSLVKVFDILLQKGQYKEVPSDADMEEIERKCIEYRKLDPEYNVIQSIIDFLDQIEYRRQ